MKRENIVMNPLSLLSILAILVILGTSLGIGIASGQIIPEPTRLGYGDHNVKFELGVNEIEAFIIPLNRGDHVVVDLTVVEGGEVDFYSMNNYSLYLTVKDDSDMSAGPGDLYFMEEGKYSHTNSFWITYEYTAIHDDTLIILVDNSNMVENGAVPTGYILISGSIDVKENIWTMENIVITLVVVVAIIIIFVGIKIPARKRREEEQRVLRQAAMARRQEQARQEPTSRRPGPRKVVRRRKKVERVTRKPKN